MIGQRREATRRYVSRFRRVLGMSGERKPRVVAAQAKIVLIEATISLLREIPVTELSTRKIEERADLDRRAITRQFGGELGLFIATLEELNRRAVERLQSMPTDANRFVGDELKIRSHLLAFLILSGVDAERLKELSHSSEGEQELLQRFGASAEIPPVIRDALLALLEALTLSRALFGPASARNTPENGVAIFKMIQYLGSIAPELPALLGLEEG